jgi:single-strand DNA-binding protein
MSSSFAYAQIGGSLGKDPEVKSTPNGTKVTTFSVAVEQGFGDNKTTGWFTVVSFKETAEFAEKHLKKGSAVRVSGTLQVRSWDDKTTGQKRYVTEVVAHKIDFGERGEAKSGQTQARAAAAPQTRQQQQPEPRAAVSDDPFADEPF